MYPRVVPEPNGAHVRDPYAPPDPDVQRAAPARHAPGKSLAFIYLAALTGRVLVAELPALAGVDPRATRPFAIALGAATTAVALAWLYSAWRGIPPSHRGSITPRRAWLSMFVPLYNVYWALAVNVALCETLDGILAHHGEARRAPRTLAGLAWVVWLGAYVVLFAVGTGSRPAQLGALATGGLWFAYMLACDAARDAVTRLGSDPASLGAPRLSAVQRSPGPGWGMAVGLVLLMLLGLACWQVLAPAERTVTGPPRGGSAAPGR